MPLSRSRRWLRHELRPPGGPPHWLSRVPALVVTEGPGTLRRFRTRRSCSTWSQGVRAAVDVPLAAGGGIHDAQGVRSLVAAGVAAAQVGTAYLLRGRSRHQPHPPSGTGRPCTGGHRAHTGVHGALGTRPRQRLHARDPDAPAGYPHIHHITAPLRKAAAAAGDKQVAHLWAGSSHTHARRSTAAQITRTLAP